MSLPATALVTKASVAKFAPLVNWLVLVGILTTPVVLLYAPLPAVKLIALRARALVKYWLVPSLIASVSNVRVPPSATLVPLIVMLLLAKELLGMLPKLIVPVELL